MTSKIKHNNTNDSKILMKKTVLFIASLAMALFAGNAASAKSVTDFVDPFIGTGGHGHTYPGATMPHGAVQLSPDTRTGDWDACSGYHYSDSQIYGFSHNHLSGTGCADFADALFHPDVTVGTPGNLYQSTPFSHANEVARPGYYSVKLDNGIRAELTATTYAGVHRYTYPAQASPKMVIDMLWTTGEEVIYEASVEQTAANEIVGMRNSLGFVDQQHIYFVAQFSCNISDFAAYNDGKLIAGKKAEGTKVQASFALDNRVVTVKVGLSTVSIENARQNLIHDTGNTFDFDGVRQAANQQWEKALSCFTIDDKNADAKKVFYTALYHAMVVPNITSDANGEYRAHDQSIRRLDEGCKEYSTLSLWDTFRAWHPLMTLIDHDLVRNINNSMLNSYSCDKVLPIWPLSSGETGCMIGYHSVAVLAEAYLKGIRNFDVNKALEAMIATANTRTKGLDYYVKNGFIPQNGKRESVSCLLEYAYDDWCIAQFARAIGRIDVHDQYMKRSQQYVNVFDGSTRFFRGKRSDGNWQSPFNPFEVGHAYTEATAWQYRFFVPHDVKGMEQLFGGREKFVAALDSIYTAQSDTPADLVDITGLIGQYAHGNEPSHHISYLYSYIGQPWKTQERNLEVLKTLYSTAPDGLCGNEDCGQMSAWYIMSSLGLYAVAPASGEYVLSTPLFRKATIRLANGRNLTIIGGDSKATPYIAKVELNGKAINTTYITHEQLMQGGVLKFTLSAKPTDWGTKASAAPYSFTRQNMVSIPYVSRDLNLFTGTIDVEIGSATDGAEIRYTLDGTEPTMQSELYTAPLAISSTTDIKAKAFKVGYLPSATMSIRSTEAINRPATTLSCNDEALLKHGVTYEYFEGPFLKVEDIVGNPVSTGVLDEPRIDGSAKPDHFAFVFSGFIKAPCDGIYTFFTRSDDGSVLIIDDELVVDNNDSHAAVTATGTIALQKGLHRFTLKYFDDYEGEHLSWGWRIPSENKMKAISADCLYYLPKK